MFLPNFAPKYLRMFIDPQSLVPSTSNTGKILNGISTKVNNINCQCVENYTVSVAAISIMKQML